MNLKRFMPKKLMLWQLVLPALALANIAYLGHSIFTLAYTLCFFLVIPGYLLWTSFKQSVDNRWTAFSLSVGLSLSILIFSGLILNSFHVLGLTRPLTSLNIFITLDAVTAILLLINLRKEVILKWPYSKPTLEQSALFVVCSLLPILAIGGANRLNNGASNILTMIVMGIIALLFVVLVSRPSLRPLFPYAVFTIGLSILFGNSLRGWDITGHDIHHEFATFQSVMRLDYWRPVTSQGDPYNACLSIAILPAIFAKITHIQDAYVYKSIYQILFASFLPTLYYMFKRFTTPVFAVLGVLAFMTFPTFTNDLPFLNRQEIAFIFFILLLFVNFLKLRHRVKFALTYIFLISLVLSHYSTSYVTLALMLLATIFYKLLSRNTSKTTSTAMPLLSYSVILVGFLITFAWNAQVTASTGNLTNTIRDTIENIAGNSKQAGFTYSLFAPPTSKEPARKFAAYAASQEGKVQQLPEEILPVTKLGSFLSNFIYKGHDLDKINVVFHAILAKLLQLLVVAGVIVVFVQRRKHIPNESMRYFIALGFSCLIGLAAFTILPQLSSDYDVTRLFQQSLIVLWLPSIMLAYQLFFFMKRFRIQATAILFAFLYLNLTGFVPQLTGGFPAQLPLNNAGVYYDFFYTHTSDIVSANWLGKNYDTHQPIYIDNTSGFPLIPYTMYSGFVHGDRPGYLFVDYTDTNRNSYQTIIQGKFIQYRNPSILTNRNLIYSTQVSKIYKRTY